MVQGWGGVLFSGPLNISGASRNGSSGAILLIWNNPVQLRVEMRGAQTVTIQVTVSPRPASSRQDSRTT